MIARRAFLRFAAGSVASFGMCRVAPAETNENFMAPLDFPPFDANRSPELFGFSPPTQAQRDKADLIIANTSSRLADTRLRRAQQ